MMKRRYRLLIPAVAPLLLKSGYLLEAWRHSPLDRWDWCFFLLAGILTAAGWKRIRNWAGRPDWRGLWFLLPAVAVWGAGIVKQVNAVQTGGALLILFSSLFVLGGVRLFSGMLPILLIALAGCPSTTYWSEYYIRISAGTAPVGGLAFKCCAAAALSVYFLLVRRVYRLQTLLFVLGVLLLIGVLYSRESRAGYGQPLLIDPERTEVGGYLGFPSALSEQEQRFFEGHAVRRAVYYGSVENIRLLAVGITGDIHRIHPAELCLKSMDCDVLSSREKILNPGGRPLAVQEIVALFPNRAKALIYVWYSGPEWSSGNFPAFRRSWKRSERWFAYQLSTPMPDSREAAEERLRDFLVNTVFSSGTRPER